MEYESTIVLPLPGDFQTMQQQEEEALPRTTRGPPTGSRCGLPQFGEEGSLLDPKHKPGPRHDEPYNPAALHLQPCTAAAGDTGAGGGSQGYQLSSGGPGATWEVIHPSIPTVPLLIYTSPMCGPNPAHISRPNRRKSTGPSTPMAPSLPPMVTAPVGGGIRRGCAENKRATSRDVTSNQPGQTPGSRPVTSHH